jgi:hypothetical protein
MKMMKTISVPATTREALDYIKCELCPTQTRSDGYWPTNIGYRVDDVEVEYVTGDSYPEGGSTKTVILDICPKCFEEKLVPWFRSQGGVPRVEERD